MFNEFNGIESSGCMIGRQLQRDGWIYKRIERGGGRLQISARWHVRSILRPVVLEDTPGERVGNLGALLAHVKYPASVLRMPRLGSYAPV